MAAAEQILGLCFFQGTPQDAARIALQSSALVVVPSGTCFQRLCEDEEYRRAMLSADMVLPDSGFMVILWRALCRHRISRISGLAYLRALLGQPEFRRCNATLWVLPNERAAAKFRIWNAASDAPLSATETYIAPIYGVTPIDPQLVARLAARRPDNIVICLSGGVQEKLAAYLRKHLDYRPAIHCIGGALGFITGDQVPIPRFVDALYLGWLLRLITNPRRFVPRATQAFVLPWLIAKYGSELPPLKAD